MRDDLELKYDFRLAESEALREQLKEVLSGKSAGQALHGLLIVGTEAILEAEAAHGTEESLMDWLASAEGVTMVREQEAYLEAYVVKHGRTRTILFWMAALQALIGTEEMSERGEG